MRYTVARECLLGWHFLGTIRFLRHGGMVERRQPTESSGRSKVKRLKGSPDVQARFAVWRNGAIEGAFFVDNEVRRQPGRSFHLATPTHMGTLEPIGLERVYLAPRFGV